MYYKSELLFYKDDLFNYLQTRKLEIKESINNEKEDYILNVGQESYILHLIQEYSCDYLELSINDVYATSQEENIPAKLFPTHFHVFPNKSYPKLVYYFHVPFRGDSRLLRCRPSTYSLSPPRADVKNNEIILKVIQFRDDVSELNKDYESFVNNLEDMIGNVNKDLKGFNDALEKNISTVFTTRKNELLKRREQQSSLIVPLKRKTDIPDTFAVPSPRIKKKIHIKPVQTTRGYTPDPTLDNATYLDILKIINDMGKEFERKPSVYTNKGEEDLRDHFIMMLEPNFDGSATGETFNKSGKTDILLRHDGSNVFVAECKFWKGAKSLLKTIDQLLGYLTWRDSKTAIIMFVTNKDFTNVVTVAKESIGRHHNFVKYEKTYDESWINYVFHINDDKNKEIKLALMLYHTP